MYDDPVALGALAYACRVYDDMTPFGRSYRKLLEQTGGTPDLSEPEDRSALLRWLNAWGCRHLDD